MECQDSTRPNLLGVQHFGRLGSPADDAGRPRPVVHHSAEAKHPCPLAVDLLLFVQEQPVTSVVAVGCHLTHETVPHPMAQDLSMEESGGQNSPRVVPVRGKNQTVFIFILI